MHVNYYVYVCLSVSHSRGDGEVKVEERKPQVVMIENIWKDGSDNMVGGA